MSSTIKYVAIGDSFTEGVGDNNPDGSLRGWADRTAQGLADAKGETILYANLAIRGRLLKPIVEEQLGPALDLQPTLVSFNGGGNDMLRPGTDIQWISEATEAVLAEIQSSGAEPILLAGANPTGGLPSGGKVKFKGDALVKSAAATAAKLGIKFADNWSDQVLWSRQYWDSDRLHLAPIGHTRVASNVLRALGHEPPSDWITYADPQPKPGFTDEASYIYNYVLPWIGRRLTGRSSGDGRSPKHPTWVEVHPTS